MPDIPRQDTEYLDGFRAALEDILGDVTYVVGPSEALPGWADNITDRLQDAGWRMVTAEDWEKMTSAWMMQALR